MIDKAEILKAKILMVDDESSNIIVLESALKQANYSCITSTTDSRKAASLYQELKPDLVLLDLRMPHLDGFQVIEQIKQIENDDSYAPILVLTAESDPSVRLKALQFGARDFLSKPLDLSEVLCRIQNILEVRLLNKNLGAQKDFVEQRVLERTADLKLANQQLKKEIAERERSEKELQNVNQQLLHVEKLSALGQLAASIAHEFNNPLMGIRNTLEQVQQGTTMEDSLKELVELSINESNRVMNLAHQLKDFYRPTSGTPQPLNLHNAIDDMLMLKKNDFNKENIQLTKEYVECLPDVRVVEDQFKQVILNLLQNSNEACKKGGAITIRTKVLNSNVEVEIEDIGQGIKQQHMEKIFDPFFTTKGEVKGTGLGLSVSYGIIKKHGGDLKVRSTEGRGTQSIITLPINSNGEESI
ncbi:MAG: response regulator [Nitrospina sp.]|nr:response regulator [Nitrospina sp.]MBT3509733.1 response regulator [Nitrospina sp.]MBT3876372.1 response regulator [Nitrospina sp.]MBT4049731.1 response regulator [Nitrospina sp.]MBT4558787.1 response regulator [Nitrospina sp.]